jgi:hypothetical protein
MVRSLFSAKTQREKIETSFTHIFNYHPSDLEISFLKNSDDIFSSTAQPCTGWRKKKICFERNASNESEIICRR